MSKDHIDLGCGDTLVWEKGAVPEQSIVQGIKDSLEMHYADYRYFLGFDGYDDHLAELRG